MNESFSLFFEVAFASIHPRIRGFLEARSIFGFVIVGQNLFFGWSILVPSMEDGAAGSFCFPAE